MVNQEFMGGLGILSACLISLLSPFICSYSTNIKRFAWKLTAL
jgi:hypothetical protein